MRAASRGERFEDRAFAVAIGLATDALMGEPPSRVHPVARFGALMETLEERRWRDDRVAGAEFALAGVGCSVVVGFVSRKVLRPSGSLAVATALCAAGRSLLESASAIAARLDEGDLEGARRLLPTLVGRDPDGLDEKEISRAVVESLAENLSDAVVATAVWGLLGGAPGALAHRAANTLDAMVGHRSARYARFGWAAARMDDAMGWPAARFTALLVALAKPRSAGLVWRAVRNDARAHPSPNAGVAEAAFAAALGLRLGGPSTYEGRLEIRPSLGSGRSAEPADLRRAIELVRRLIFGLVLALVGSASVARFMRRRGLEA